MSELVTRLRDLASHLWGKFDLDPSASDTVREAAAEIERLTEKAIVGEYMWTPAELAEIRETDRAALADCIALLDTFAEVAQERGETVDWAMLSVMADKHRPLIASDEEIKRQAESLGRNDSRGERQAVLK